MGAYTAILDGIVHEPSQRHDGQFDLTLNAVHELTQPGRVDFGGGELESAETQPHPTEKRNPDDDYAWWKLDPGTYLIDYNESLTSESATVRVQTRTALLERGAFHPTITTSRLPRLPLTVGPSGIKLKANARISTITNVTQE